MIAGRGLMIFRLRLAVMQSKSYKYQALARVMIQTIASKQ